MDMIIAYIRIAKAITIVEYWIIIKVAIDWMATWIWISYKLHNDYKCNIFKRHLLDLCCQGLFQINFIQSFIYCSTLAILTHVYWIIYLFWNNHFKKWNIFKYLVFSFIIFFDLEEIIFENFNISENNIISVELAKALEVHFQLFSNNLSNFWTL